MRVRNVLEWLEGDPGLKTDESNTAACPTALEQEVPETVVANEWVGAIVVDDLGVLGHVEHVRAANKEVVDREHLNEVGADSRSNVGQL